MRGKSRVKFLRHNTPKTVYNEEADYVVNNGTENMMKANPGMSREEAREKAMDKLYAALKDAMSRP